ncbi:MAG TPA: hypothetical protein VKU82_15505 [Planctomycetaceae bacterium]|nr:hypothetical protein [Planctomycetaceae bacterium]
MFDAIRPVIMAAAVLSLSSCGKNAEPPHRETFPVTGEVEVDGSPAADVAVTFTDVKGFDAKNPILSSAYTDKEGKFKISTFKEGDGVPEGEYVLTFEWCARNAFTGVYGGPDKFKGRYNDPKISPFKVTVKKGVPNEHLKIGLVTKQ